MPAPTAFIRFFSAVFWTMLVAVIVIGVAALARTTAGPTTTLEDGLGPAVQTSKL